MKLALYFTAGMTLLLNVAPASGQAGSSVDDIIDQANTVAEARLLDMFNDKASFLSIRRINHSDSEEDDGWAVDYDWTKNWGQPFRMQLDNQSLGFSGSSVKAFAKGSAALGSATNNEERSSAGLTAEYRGMYTNLVDQPNSVEYIECVTGIPVAADLDTTAHEARCALLHAGSGASIAYDAGLSYTIEGNEDFTEEHEVYSAHATTSYRPTPGSIVDKLNILDYPFRALRQATGSQDPYTAKLPSIHFALQQVDPKDDTNRNELIDGEDTFDRIYLEASFATKAFKLRNAYVTFEASYRVYDEQDAPGAVRAAGLDHFEYTKAGLFFPVRVLGFEVFSDEIFIEYSKGDLPFDISRGEALSIGWKTNIKSLLQTFVPTN